MKTLRFISRVITGIVFVFSGFVKGIDPLGSTYKFTDYFNAFGLEFLTPLALPLAIILSTAEFTIGAFLLFNIKTKTGTWGALLFMAFFTPLTLILAIKNPVHDCGCFGDALILTNWQTFYKNIFILALVLFAFYSRKKYASCFSNLTETSIAGFFVFSILLLSVYCYRHLPLIDFLPYKTGSNIPAQMVIPEGAPSDEYDISLIYQKNGITKEFTVEEMPDSTWTWVKTESILKKKGYEPPIKDFKISTPQGMEITDIILEDNHYTFLLIAYDLKKTSAKNQEKINELATYCKNNNIRFICLTSSISSEIKEFKQKNNNPYNFYNTDEIPLKTMVRSNPGLVLLKKGTVLDKWHYNDIPDSTEVKSKYSIMKAIGNCDFCD